MKKFFVIGMLAITLDAHATTYLTDFRSVIPAQDHTLLGSNGSAGDILERLVINVTTSGTSVVKIMDGPSTAGSVDLVVVPASTPIGTYSIPIGARSTRGGWRVTTGAGASVIAVGSFR